MVQKMDFPFDMPSFQGAKIPVGYVQKKPKAIEPLKSQPLISVSWLENKRHTGPRPFAPHLVGEEETLLHQGSSETEMTIITGLTGLGDPG